MSQTLEDCIDNPLLLSLRSEPAQISRHRLVNLNQPGLTIDHLELMLVRDLMSPRPQLTDGLIMVVHEGDMPMAMACTNASAHGENIHKDPTYRSWDCDPPQNKPTHPHGR